MSYGETASHGHDNHDHTPGFIRRWFFSTNHKDIGTLYIIFSLIAGLIGGFFSLIMRAELAAPGLDIVADGQAWNVIITAHGLLMVFFVVMPALIGGFGNWFILSPHNHNPNLQATKLYQNDELLFPLPGCCCGHWT